MTGNGHNGAKNGRGSGRNGGTATATNGRWTTGSPPASERRRRRDKSSRAASSSCDHRPRPHRRGRAHGRCLHGRPGLREQLLAGLLEAVSIGENSFVYAADGSLLGSIPAEQNRQPVALDQMSPLLARAPSRSRTGASTPTPASTSRASSARPSRTSRARSCRAARRSRSSLSATSTSAATSPGSGRRGRPASR